MVTPTESSILNRLFPSGIPYGVGLLVEYAPDSLWYETSLTIAAQALKQVETEYHTFDHPPGHIREALTKLGADVAEKEKDGALYIVDSYTTQLGIGVPEGPSESVIRRSLKIADWSIAFAHDMKAATQLKNADRINVDTPMHEHVHIDDNLSALLRYNDERSIIEWVRTRALPDARNRKQLNFLGVPTGIAADFFYKQLELACDGILDFKSEEREGQLQHYVRVRTLRGKSVDSRWQGIRILANNGEVTFIQ